MSERSFTTAVLLICLLGFSIHGLAAAADRPFYEGKTLTVIVGTSAGGTGDLRAKGVTQYLQKHLLGNPAVVYKYIPNVIQAANQVANVEKRDGLSILFMGPTLFSNGIMGAQGVRYRVEDFIPLGSPSPGGPYLMTTRPGLDLDSVEKLKAYRGLRFAQRTVGHSMYILDRLMAFVLELPEPKWVLGYNSPEVYLALERKEADSLTTTIPGFMEERGQWLKEGFSVPVIMRNTKGRGAEVDPNFPQGRPAVDQYADTKLKQDILKLHNAMRPSGMLFFAPKGVPDPALKALRVALDRAWADPGLAKDFHRLTGESADPMVGEEIEASLRELPQNPQVREIYKQIIGAGPLPSAR